MTFLFVPLQQEDMMSVILTKKLEKELKMFLCKANAFSSVDLIFMPIDFKSCVLNNSIE